MTASIYIGLVLVVLLKIKTEKKAASNSIWIMGVSGTARNLHTGRIGSIQAVP